MKFHMKEMMRMYRRKDFVFMNVLNLKGKKIGYIKELLIDCNKNKVIGFSVATQGMFSKEISVLMENVIYHNKDIIIKDFTRESYYSFDKLEDMDVVDLNGDILGLVKDIIFDEESFFIKGVVVSTGIIRDFTKGKKILLMKNLLIGDENILYYSRGDEIQFSSKAHKISKFDEECVVKNEKS